MLNALSSDSSKLFAKVDHFSRAALLWFNQWQLFREETHPLTFMLQNFDADVLRTHRLHWQQP